MKLHCDPCSSSVLIICCVFCIFCVFLFFFPPRCCCPLQRVVLYDKRKAGDGGKGVSRSDGPGWTLDAGCGVGHSR